MLGPGIGPGGRSCCARPSATCSPALLAGGHARHGGRTRSGMPPTLWLELGELDLIGLLLPEEYGGSGMSLHRGGGPLRGARPRPGADAPLRQRRHERRRARRGRGPNPAGAVVAGRRPRRGRVTPAWLEPENGFSPLEAWPPKPPLDRGRRLWSLHGLKPGVALRLRRPTACWSWPAPVTPPRTSTSSSSTPSASGVSLRQQFSIAWTPSTRSIWPMWVVWRRRSARPAPGGRPGSRCSSRPVSLAAQAVGRARYALEITTSTRWTGATDKPLGAFQARPTPADAVTTRRREQLVHEAAWAGAIGRSARLRWPRWPSCSPAPPSATSRRWPSSSSAASDSPRLRHPALLPPSQAAAVDVGQRPRPRGCRGRRPSRLTDGGRAAATPLHYVAAPMVPRPDLSLEQVRRISLSAQGLRGGRAGGGIAGMLRRLGAVSSTPFRSWRARMSS